MISGVHFRPSCDDRAISPRLAMAVLLGVMAAFAPGCRSVGTDGPRQTKISVAEDPAIAKALALIRTKHGLPAMAGAIVTGDGRVAVGVTGVRKAGNGIAVTVDDQWHLGSDTKAMTAVVIARLVEQGRLSWDTKLADVFPELAPRFDPGYADVTVRMLLNHRAGLPRDLNWRAFGALGDLPEQRRLVVASAFAVRPAYELNSAVHYSNLGYVIAGAVIERVIGMTWEDAVRARVFEPLKMTAAGFGGTGTLGKIDQPWPHGPAATPADRNGPGVDNPAVMAPAGCVHCSMADWSRFVLDQLRGARGEMALLKPGTYGTLQTPPAGCDYAMGWGIVQRGWGGGTVLNHNGCNTLNFAVAWIAPRRDFAVLVCVNQGDAVAAKAADEAASELIGLWLRRNGH